MDVLVVLDVLVWLFCFWMFLRTWNMINLSVVQICMECLMFILDVEEVPILLCISESVLNETI